MYSKNEHTLESIGVSIYLHDNFWRNSPTVMKFSTPHYPMNISVEFENGYDSSRIYWFSARTTVISSSFDGNIDPFQFSKTIISHIVKMNLRLLYVIRERILSYKVILSYWDKYVTLKDSSLSHFSNAMKKFIHFDTVPEWFVFIPYGIGIIFPELIELIRAYKMILNSRDNYAGFPIISFPCFQK